MSTFDFIVVGSGPAGSLLASRLAGAASRPSVLLLEAGGDEPDKETLSLESRWSLFHSQPSLGWGYKSTGQPHLNDRAIDISRGKALGGSTNINFSCWTPPNKDFIDEWQARVGGDSLYSWESSQRLLDGIVKYGVRDLTSGSASPLHALTGRSVTEYVEVAHPEASGPYEAEWSAHLKKGDATVLDGGLQHGFIRNRDMTSGDSLGIGIMPSSTSEGKFRNTASTAFLAQAPQNLTIKTGLEVSRVIFDGKTAKAVEVGGGEQVFEARRSVVLSAGSINTPKLLMLSGVGPADHLAANNIPLVADLPAVGQNLKDHFAMFLTWKVDDEFAGKPLLPSISPSPNQDMLNVVVVFDRDETMMQHPGFKNLPADEQRLLQRRGTPTLEIAVNCNWPPGPDKKDSTVSLGMFHLLPQSSGSVTLASADWSVAPNINLNFFSDEGGLDLSAAEAYVRKAIDIMERTESLSRHVLGPVVRPKTDSKEHVMAFIREETNTVWHPSCTTRMGPQGDSHNSVVDPSFKVHNVENLRIVDLGVPPVIPNYHPVSMALLIGAWAAERMMDEYYL